jgi:hypothetical protein
MEDMEDLEDMEGLTFKKDEKPYLVFPCTKCGQYTYAKLTQKGKRCLRCGRSHQIKKMKNTGEVVSGMSKAVETVKQRQSELAREELGKDPEFTSKRSFRKKFAPSFEPQTFENSEGSKSDGGYENFKIEVRKKTNHFPEFPEYVLKLIAEDLGLSKEVQRNYIKKLKKQGFVKVGDSEMFKISQKTIE